MARIPIIGVYNTRFEALNAIPTSSGIGGIGVVGVMIVGKSSLPSDKDQRFINCYPVTVKNPATQTQTAYLIKRPGFAANATVEAGSIGNDIHIWIGESSGQKIISAFGGTNSKIYDGATTLGAITGVCTGITETILSGTANLAFTSTDSTGWFYDTSVTKISDTDFPGNASRTLAGTFVHMNGYAFVMDTTGRIYNSDLNSLSSWTANSYITANMATDKGIALAKHRNHILAFGSESMEVFYDAGNAAGSPLQRQDDATVLIGLINRNAIVAFEDLIAFVGSSGLGAISVYILDGFIPAKVSTPEIDSQLILAATSTIYLSACRLMGRTMVVLTAGSITYVYCLEEKLWHEWNSETPLWHKMSGTAVGSSFVTYAVSAVSTLGKTYVVNPASFVFQDDSNAYSAIFQSSLIDFGTQSSKTMTSLAIIGDRPSTASSLSVAFSDNDYQSFTTKGTVDLSAEKPMLTRCGTFSRRSVKLTHSANLAMRLEALDPTIIKAVH